MESRGLEDDSEDIKYGEAGEENVGGGATGTVHVTQRMTENLIPMIEEADDDEEEEQKI